MQVLRSFSFFETLRLIQSRTSQYPRRSAPPSLEPAAPGSPLFSPGLQVAGDFGILFLRDIVVLGYGWRQRWMVAGGVGSDCGSGDHLGDLDVRSSVLSFPPVLLLTPSPQLSFLELQSGH
jgi:hypothetical protein